MGRFSLTAVLIIILTAPASASSHTRHSYVKHTFSAQAVAGSAAGAGVNHLRHSPPEWGQGVKGFGKRFASSFGTHIVKNTIHYGVAGLRHEEVGYRPSGKQGFGPRMKYALTSTVITHKTTTGKRTVASGELAGAFGSGLISRAWQPASARTIGAGIGSGGVMLGADAGSHAAKEFWPEIRHPFHRRRTKRIG